MTLYALYHLFGPKARDLNGNPLCEVFAFEENEAFLRWLGENPERGQAVDEQHPTIQLLLGPSQVFEIATPFEN